MEPALRDYWDKRQKARLKALMVSKKRLRLLEKQGHACAQCKVRFDPDDEMEDMDEHHHEPRRGGGSEAETNLRLVHRWCHQAHHRSEPHRVCRRPFSLSHAAMACSCSIA